MEKPFIDRMLGSGTPYITYAVPVFFALIFLEIAVAWYTHRRLYRLNDTINDLSCGITEQLVGIFLKVVLFGGYLWCYDLVTRNHVNLVDVERYSVAGKWVAAVVLFLGVDMAYYWFHRIAHEYNAPWAGHVTHHSSEEYNLAVALRQGTFQGLFSWVFYLPLALLGFPPLWFAAMSSFDTLYQFWIHTRAIGKLGPLEWVMNTPSHHRVHHARNPKYLDKNYAGTLIIWDRMFGTFQVEEEEPVYGLTKPLNSWNPLWANLHVFVELAIDAWNAPRWIDKFRIWIMPQGWRPPGLPPRPPQGEVSRATVKPYDPHVSLGLSAYIVVQFALVLAVAVAALALLRRAPASQSAPVVVAVLLSLVHFGAMFEHRRWVFPGELMRIALLLIAGIALAQQNAYSAIMITGLVAWAAISAVWLWVCHGELDGARPEPSRIISAAEAEATAANAVVGQDDAMAVAS